MTAFILYLLGASVLLAVLQIFYSAYLQKLTFFHSNRWFLVGSLIISCLGPLLPYPSWQTPIATPEILTSLSVSTTFTTSPISPQVLPAERSLLATVMEAFTFLYWAVVILLLIRLLLRVLSLIKLTGKAQKESYKNYTLLIHPGIETPFSFFGYIGIYKERYAGDTLNHILDHEEVHLRQWHSADLLLMEIYLLFFWFNPFAWWHKKQMALNLEYLADDEVLKGGANPQAYQLSLLSISSNQIPIPLTNPFSSSIMKARIQMINQTRSAKRTWLHYSWVIVIVAGCLLLVSYSKAQFYDSGSAYILADVSGWQKANSNHSQAVMQGRVIQGIVKTAKDGKLMADVKVLVVGTSKSTITNKEGKFSIEVSEEDQILEFVPMDFYTIKSDNMYPPLAMQITSSDEMIVLLHRFIPLSPLPDTTIYFMDGKRISKAEYDRQSAKGYFPHEYLFRPGLNKYNLINMGNVE
ncbi:hypothetical protein GXP67_06890 [Rhodocytophaga rosea]|uniref:Peptidase M56 domain-containing protein n=1 Tax=Rhodocytophaga rosea TaxID=2704465 RepID=A0A6C0GF67_9BACT|nr:M56 family metallopeptidase [Rhodocytophaga rosea]QHT66403.1 hypothetical protein GXP67_06890 [Rhodocytophaga rosea]